MSLELNIQITNAPASLPSLRYTIYEQPLDNETKLVELGDGTLSDVVNGDVNIPFTTGTLGAVVGVLLENADGTNVTSAKSAFGWTSVVDSAAPVDPDPVEFTNAYLFSSSDGDSFILSENFTGELKVAWASNATTGVNANLISGLQSAFVATTDYQDPKWNYSIFQGSNKWALNGRSFAKFPAVTLNKSWEIGITCAGLLTNDEIISGGTGEINSISIDVTSGTVRAFAKVASTTVGLMALSFTGVTDVIKLSVNATGTATLTVNGTTATADWSSLNGSQVIEYIAKRGESVSAGGTYTDFYYTTGGVTRTFPLLSGYSISHTLTDTSGTVAMTKVNDGPNDYTVTAGVKTVVDSTFNGVVGKYAKDGVWYELNIGSDVDTFAPQPQATTVLMLGASIESAVIASNTGYMNKALYQLGVPNVTFVDVSLGGRHVDEIQVAWDEVKSTYASAGENCLVFTHPLANDIISYNPYSSTTQANKDKVSGWLTTLLASITANGNVPIMVESTFQSFTSPKMSIESWTDESLGAKPWNEALAYPASKELSPKQWLDKANIPYISSYNWSFNYMKQLSSDGTHWTDVGSGLLRRLWSENLANYIKGIDPIVVEKLSATEAFNFTPEPLEVLLYPSVNIDTLPARDVLGANLWRFSAANTSRDLIPMYGYAPTSVKVSSTANVMTHGTNSDAAFPFRGSYAAALDNYTIKKTYCSTDSSSYVNLMTISGLVAGNSYKVGFASYYELADTRKIMFSVNGDEVNTVECNASLNSIDNVKYAIFTANASGQLVIRCKKSSGYLAHFNGIHVIPQ